MAGRVEGKVAFITGAARGQGRAHAVRLAQEGADIIAVDICKQIDTVDQIAASTPEDLAETADLVKNAGGRILTAEVDVRDYDALKAAVDAGVEEFGRLDIIVANAGIGNGGQTLDKTSEADWTDDDRRQPERRVEDRESRCPAYPRRRQRRLDHPDQLGRRPEGLPAHRPLRRRQTRRGRPDADVRRRTRRAEHPGQLGAPDEREHPAVHERGHHEAVPPRPGEPGPPRT